MNALVTGGAGFVGSNLVKQLLADGHVVRVIDDLSTGDLGRISDLSIEFVEGSITDPTTVAVALVDVEVVFHQAAVPSVPRSIDDPLGSHHAASTGTLTMLQQAHRAGVRRFVYAASSSAYGDVPELPKQEDMRPRPVSPYAVAKLSGEYYCKAYSVVHGLDTVSLRYFNVFGPLQSPHGGYAAVIPRFISALLAGDPPTINGDGEQTRDFTYVDDVVSANLAAASTSSRLDGAVVNIAGGSQISVNELYRTVGEVLGISLEPVFGPARRGDVRDSWASIEKAAQLLDWSPETSLREGLARTVAWFTTDSA